LGSTDCQFAHNTNTIKSIKVKCACLSGCFVQFYESVQTNFGHENRACGWCELFDSMKMSIVVRLKEGVMSGRNTTPGITLKCGKVDSNEAALTNCVYLSAADYAQTFARPAEGTWLRVKEQVFVTK
jgi:hypothetical protein